MLERIATLVEIIIHHQNHFTQEGWKEDHCWLGRLKLIPMLISRKWVRHDQLIEVTFHGIENPRQSIPMSAFISLPYIIIENRDKMRHVHNTHVDDSNRWRACYLYLLAEKKKKTKHSYFGHSWMSAFVVLRNVEFQFSPLSGFSSFSLLGGGYVEVGENWGKF